MKQQSYKWTNAAEAIQRHISAAKWLQIPAQQQQQRMIVAAISLSATVELISLTTLTYD